MPGQVPFMGVEAQFEEEFSRLFLRAYRLAYRMLGDREAAEDVAADALAITLARWPRVAPLPHREGWVLRVTGNLAIKAAKKRSRPVPGTALGTTRFDDDSAVRLALAEALAKLPGRQREAVVLRYLSGLSEAEVAALTGVSSGTVKTHLHRGIRSLRERLGPTFEEVDLAVDG
jgi:RNA polymerase sigma factor (sigma-70 family)